MQEHGKSLNTTTAAAHTSCRPRRFHALGDVVKVCLRGYSRQAEAYSSGDQPLRFSRSPLVSHTLRLRVLQLKRLHPRLVAGNRVPGLFPQLLRLQLSTRKAAMIRGQGALLSTCGVTHTSGARRKASNLADPLTTCPQTARPGIASNRQPAMVNALSIRWGAAHLGFAS
jgi:hypothetical protein